MSIVTILLCQKAVLMRHKLGLYTAAYGSFTVIGSLLFSLIESGAYVQSQVNVLDAKERVLRTYGNISAEALDAFMDELRDLGFRGLPNKEGTVTEWRFSDSYFFVTTLLTTVGYGHYAPRTLLGKITCIIFTSIGIPITLMFLAGYVDMLLKLSERFKAFLFRRYQHIHGAFSLRLIHVSSLMTCIVLSCFIFPAFVFTYMERKWKFIEGVYFSFISLTTIGLGDMVPGLDPDGPNSDLYKICVSLYLIVGVMLIMFMMAMCGDFHRNYKSPYEILPYTIAAEKVPFNPGGMLTYGSTITESGKSEPGEKK